MNILVIAEHDNANLKGATLNTIAAAKDIGSDITLLVAGSDTASVISEAQQLNGVTKILSCDNDLYKNSLAEELSNLVVSLASSFSFILAPATTFGKNLLPRVSAKLDVQQNIFNPEDGKRHWVYVGRGGEDMALALRSLFMSIQHHRRQHPEAWQFIQLHFVGTSYAPEGLAIKTVEPIAKEFGIADLVNEHTSRIPYFEAVKIIKSTNCSNIGMSLGTGETVGNRYWEYPLWPLLSDNNVEIKRMQHINPGNISHKKSDIYPYKDFQPCAVIAVRQDDEKIDKLITSEQVFVSIWSSNPVSVLVEK